MDFTPGEKSLLAQMRLLYQASGRLQLVNALTSAWPPTHHEAYRTAYASLVARQLIHDAGGQTFSITDAGLRALGIRQAPAPRPSPERRPKEEARPVQQSSSTRKPSHARHCCQDWQRTFSVEANCVASLMELDHPALQGTAASAPCRIGFVMSFMPTGVALLRPSAAGLTDSESEELCCTAPL